MQLLRLASLALVLLLARSAAAYYLPGTYPREFKAGDQIEAETNSLVSSETELPFAYYSMPYCKPASGVKKSTGTINPGTILLGIRIENSPYVFNVMEEKKGLFVCKGTDYPKNAYSPLIDKEVQRLQEKIKQQYRARLILDNLPITMYDLDPETGPKPESVMPGFEVGYELNKKFYVNNHLMFKVLVHETHGEYTRTAAEEAEIEAASAVEAGGRRRRHMLANPVPAAAGPGGKMYMIVGFEVVACSIKREPGKPAADVMCPQYANDPAAPPPQEVVKGAEIVYTYDVYWGLSDIPWASRWDSYLRMPGGKVHWFSILNSLMVVVVMSAIVAMIMMRTVRRDLQRYEQLLVDPAAANEVEESGWKMISGDVFRAPQDPLALCVYVGSGVQIIAASTGTLIFAMLGFLSPASRGSLLTALLVMYLLLSVAAGYAAVWLWGLVNRSYDDWYKVCWRVACYFPGGTLVVLSVLNVFLWASGSSGAIPLGFFFSVLFLWLLISTPLAYSGGMLAARREIATFPTRTNQIPRHVPPPHWASHPVVLLLAAGLLPFGTIFVELYFAMTSMWQGYFYYIFGFLFLVALLTVVVTIEVSIVTTYVQLCAEDYLWWWRSFHRGGSIALYVMLYSVGFLVNTLHNLSGAVPMLLYVSYMGLLTWGIFLAMGTIGFLSSYLFTYSIFASVKAD